MYCLYFKKIQLLYNYNFSFLKKNNKKLIMNNLYSKMLNTKSFKLDKFCKKINITFYFKINENYYYNFNYLNSYYLKSLLNIINKILENNKNVLFFDYDYKSVLPIYNYFYGYKNIQNNKSFFLLKKKFITSTNWLYFYSSFINSFNIKCLFFLDYYEFSKFFKFFLKFNLPIISIVPHNVHSCYIDYYFYINYFDLNLNKIILYNFISSNIFFNNNIKNYFFKKNYLSLLLKLSNTIIKY